MVWKIKINKLMPIQFLRDVGRGFLERVKGVGEAIDRGIFQAPRIRKEISKEEEDFYRSQIQQHLNKTTADGFYIHGARMEMTPLIKKRWEEEYLEGLKRHPDQLADWVPERVKSVFNFFAPSERLRTKTLMEEEGIPYIEARLRVMDEFERERIEGITMTGIGGASKMATASKKAIGIATGVLRDVKARKVEKLVRPQISRLKSLRKHLAMAKEFDEINALTDAIGRTTKEVRGILKPSKFKKAVGEILEKGWRTADKAIARFRKTPPDKPSILPEIKEIPDETTIKTYLESIKKEIEEKKLPIFEKEVQEHIPKTLSCRNPLTNLAREFLNHITTAVHKIPGVRRVIPADGRPPEAMHLIRERNRVMDSLMRRTKEHLLKPLDRLSPETRAKITLMTHKYVPTDPAFKKLIKDFDIEMGVFGKGRYSKIDEWVRKGWVDKADYPDTEEAILKGMGRYLRSYYIDKKALERGEVLLKGKLPGTELLSKKLYKRKLTPEEWGRMAYRHEGKFMDDDVIFNLSWRLGDLPAVKGTKLTTEAISKMTPDELKSIIGGIKTDKGIAKLHERILGIIEKGVKKVDPKTGKITLPPREVMLARMKRLKFDDVKPLLNEDEMALVKNLQDHYALTGDDLLQHLGKIYQAEKKRALEIAGVEPTERISYFRRLIEEAKEIVESGALIKPTIDDLKRTGIKSKMNYGWELDARVVWEATLRDQVLDYANLLYLDTIKKSPALFSTTPKKGFIAIEALLPKGVTKHYAFGPLNKGYIHQGMADEFKLLAQKGSRNFYLDIWNEVLAYWKLMKIMGGFGTPLRNFISGTLFQNDLAGYPVWTSHNFKQWLISAKDYITKGKTYKEARDAGQYGGDFFRVELDDEITRMLHKGVPPARIQDYLIQKLRRGGRAVSEIYGSIDHINRTYLYKMARLDGATNAQAVNFANKWQLDYRLVPKIIDIARKTPITPFISFPYLMTPRIIEILATRPWTLLKYPFIVAGINEFFRRKEGLTQEQVITGTPRFMRENAYNIFIGRDEKGDMQYLNFEWIMPFGGPNSLFLDVNQGVEMFSGLGPLNALTATLNNFDPFFERQIYNPDDLPEEQAKQIIAYASTVLGPAALPHFLNMYRAIRREPVGFPIPRERDLSQTIWRSIGVPIYTGGLNEALLRIRELERSIMEIERLKKKIQEDYGLGLIPLEEARKKIRKHDKAILDKKIEINAMGDHLPPAPRETPFPELLEQRREWIKKRLEERK